MIASNHQTTHSYQKVNINFFLDFSFNGEPTCLFGVVNCPRGQVGRRQGQRRGVFCLPALHPDHSKMDCSQMFTDAGEIAGPGGGGSSGTREPVPGAAIIAPGPGVETWWGPSLCSFLPFLISTNCIGVQIANKARIECDTLKTLQYCDIFVMPGR